MRGKICLVTGAASGIGKAVAAGLARTGATVVMVCRERAGGEAVAAEIRAAYPAADLRVMAADLSSPAAVRGLAEEFISTQRRLDVLVNNAAVFRRTRTLTADGFEVMLATNHLGHFLLTNLLLGHLRAAGSARILNITAPSTVRLDFENLQGERRFNALNAFGATKMANLLFTFDLAIRLQGTGIVVHAVHPGLVRSRLMREAPALLRWLPYLFSALADRAAQAIAAVAVEPEFETHTGRFYRGAKEIRAADYAYDRDVQRRLWEVSARLVGLDALA